MKLIEVKIGCFHRYSCVTSLSNTEIFHIISLMKVNQVGMKDFKKGFRKSKQTVTEGLMVSEGTMPTYPQITDMIY